MGGSWKKGQYMMGGFVFIFKLKGGGVTIIRTDSIRQQKKEQRNVNVTKQCNNYNNNEIITIERQTEPIRESDHHKKYGELGVVGGEWWI